MSDKPMNNLFFRGMCILINLRNKIHPPTDILKEAGVKPGFHVLDFGCGPGGHTVAAAELVGEEGKVYALDVHPLAAGMVGKKAGRMGLANIETIQSDCDTGLEAESLDMVILYDIFHMLDDQHGVMEELHRVLRPGGVLSVDDHHMGDDELVSSITNTGLFTPDGRGKNFFNFAKLSAAGSGNRRN